MVHIEFEVPADPLNPKLIIRAPMPVVPRVGEELIFCFRNAWPRFEVTCVEYTIHHQRNSAERPLPGDVPIETADYWDEELRAEQDEKEMSVEVRLILSRLENNAADLA